MAIWEYGSRSESKQLYLMISFSFLNYRKALFLKLFFVSMPTIELRLVTFIWHKKLLLGVIHVFYSPLLSFWWVMKKSFVF